MQIKIFRTGSINDRGFTILEMLVVLSLVALLAVIGIGSLAKASRRAKFEAIISKIERELQEVKVAANREGMDRAVTFKRLGSGVQLLSVGRRLVLEEPITFSLKTALEAANAEHESRVIFFGTGGSSGGELLLLAEGFRAKISIDWLTGDVQRERQSQ